ncbi:uncharacterized protein LOC108950140 isoform X2 [Ciona intestinalis]
MIFSQASGTKVYLRFCLKSIFPYLKLIYITICISLFSHSICLSLDLNILWVAFGGWRTDIAQFEVCNLKTTFLKEFLDQFLKYELCCGVEQPTRNTKVHHLQSWCGDSMDLKTFIRSPKCNGIVEVGGQRCYPCDKYDIKTKYNKKYTSLKNVQDDDLVTVDEDTHNDIIELYHKENDEMNDWQKMFFSNQCQNAKTSPKQRRYHPDVIRWAIELYARSPAAYNQLKTSGVLTLPSSKTLQQYRNMASNSSGINRIAMQQLKQLKDSVEGYITVDEMKVQESLVLKHGKLVGFIDYGDRKCEEKLATHICMFYIRSFKKEVSVPIAWWPTTTTPAYQLASMFWELFGVCELKGFHINAVVADGASVNRKFFEILSGVTHSRYQQYICSNPYRPSYPVFLCSYTSHLLKTTRNALFSSKPGGTKFFNKAGRDILWSHVISLYNKDSVTPLHKTNLTDAHIHLNSYSKMKVNYARDVLSWRVGQSIKQDVAGADGTSEFILLFNKWFEIVTCGVECPIWNAEDQRLHWLENIFITYLKDWREEVDINFPGEEKRIMANATFDGLIFTTINMIELTKRLLQTQRFVCLRVLTQDVLEATFGNLRSYMRHSSNPNIAQVGYGVSSITQRKCIKKIKGANTTYGNTNVWTTVCEEPLPKVAKK